MNADKAIIDLQARVDGEFNIKGVDDCEDMNLGIEALKLIIWIRQGNIPAPDFRLPTETKD